MKIEEYQKKAWRTINKELKTDELLANMIVGIFGEGGEVSDLIKKSLYQGHKLDKSAIKEEVGDMLWYIANLCNLLGLNLKEVLKENHNKLKKRYPEGFDKGKSINRKQ